MADQDKHGPIHVGNINNSTGIAIGPGATSTVTINKYDGPPPLTPAESARLLADYRTRILDETRYVNLRGIPLPRGRDGRPMPMQVPLDKVYIRIQATTEKQHRVQEEAEERSLLDRLKGESKSQATPKDILSALHTLGEYFYRRGEVYEIEQRPEPVDPEEALKKHKRLVVLGAPGAGKSTLLRYLARRAAESSENFVPVPISLRDYATALAGDSTLALSEFALRTASAGEAKLRQALEDEIKNGHILWLVDALDEARGWAANAARQAGQLPGQLILTSRPVGYVSTGLESLPHFEILPLLPENVDEFLRCWFGLLAIQRMENEEWTSARVAWLKKQLEARPSIRALTRSPLLLTFLVILAGEERPQNLPEQRSELYRRYIDELLDSWESERRPKSGAEGQPVFTLGSLQDKEARRVALQGFYYLGWALHLVYYGGKPQGPPTRSALMITLANYLQADGEKDASSLALSILDFWQEAGLLETWCLGGDDYLAFRHLTFQEYAAAWGIAEAWKQDAKRAWKFLRPRLHHYAWHEPILLLVGLLDQTHLNNLTHRLLRGPSFYEGSLHRDLFLAGELIGEGAALDVEPRIFHKLDWVRRQHINKRLVTLVLVYLLGILVLSRSGAWCCLMSPLFTIFFLASAMYIPLAWRIISYPTRVWKFMPDSKNAIRCLVRIGSPAMPILIQALKDSHQEARWKAANKTGELRLLFLEWLDIFGDARWEAAEALGQIGDTKAIPTLLQALQDNDDAVRRSAAKALGQIGDAQVVPGLIKTLQYREVSISAAAALLKIDDTQVVPGLIKTLQYRERDVRCSTAEALGQIGDAQAIPALLQALQDSDEYLRREAAKALGQIGDTQAIPALLQALQDGDEDVCREAAEALGQIGDTQAIPALIHALRFEERFSRPLIFRSTASLALGQIGPPAIPNLIQALQDKHKGTRKGAAEALGQIGDTQAIPALLRALHDEEQPVRLEVVKALGQIGDTQAIPALLQALQDGDEYVRRNVAEALGQIGDTQAIPALTQVLQDTDLQDTESFVRSSAAKALGQIGGPQAILALLQALQNKECYVRRNAAEALGQIGDAQAIPALLQAFQEEDWQVRISAGKALVQIGDTQVVPDLIQALQDKERYVRSFAAEALGQIGDPHAIPGLIKALQHRDEAMNTETAQTLGKCVEKLNNIKIGKRAAKALWWYLTDMFNADAAFRSLEQVANRLTVLKVEARPLVDPLLSGRTEKGKQ